MTMDARTIATVAALAASLAVLGVSVWANRRLRAKSADLATRNRRLARTAPHARMLGREVDVLVNGRWERGWCDAVALDGSLRFELEGYRVTWVSRACQADEVRW